MIYMKALITGASSGMRKDMAKVLSEKGYELILVARDEQKLEEAAKEIGKNTQIIVADLSDVETCKKIYEQASDIDLLINNAGFGDCGQFIETDLEKEIKMINTNITAYHILTKLYLKKFQEKNKSIAGFLPGPLMSTYYATKAYVVRLSEGIREELKKINSNVHISVLCPRTSCNKFFKSGKCKI